MNFFLRERCASIWRFVRTIATDDAYEQYLAHRREAHAGQPLLSRREFYLREQNRKWSGMQRCC